MISENFFPFLIFFKSNIDDVIVGFFSIFLARWRCSRVVRFFLGNLFFLNAERRVQDNLRDSDKKCAAHRRRKTRHVKARNYRSREIKKRRIYQPQNENCAQAQRRNQKRERKQN